MTLGRLPRQDLADGVGGGGRDVSVRPDEGEALLPRRSHLDDGRNFLRSTTKKYDLVVFALIDSLVLHSSLSNIRLESFLFTRESMADVRRRLKPDGLFVMYNYFRQGWIVSRLAKTVEDVFERPAVVLTMPYRDRIDAGEKAEGFTLFFEGPRAEAIEKAFQSGAAYLVPADVTPGPSSPNGFKVDTDTKSMRFLPTKVETPADLRVATDVWPFLYLRNPMIPDLSRRGMAVIGIISLVLLWIFGWRTGQGAFTSLDARMLLLGAGFMLLETCAVTPVSSGMGWKWASPPALNCIAFGTTTTKCSRGYSALGWKLASPE